MTIAPNGVAIADYDPTGVGAIMLCAIARSDYNQIIDFGDIVDAATVSLYAAGLIDYTADGANSIQRTGNVLPGTWKCLGLFNLSDAAVFEATALCIRVA